MNPVHPAAGFATGKKSSPQTFIADYIRLTREESGPEIIGSWLLTNAKCMNQMMFESPDNNWFELEPVHILALRAMTPSLVFINIAKGHYLTRVSGDSDRFSLADCMFFPSKDLDFVNTLPVNFRGLRPYLIKLCQQAYRNGIREADEWVRSM